MIRINLLPHREEKRKQRMAAFFALLALGGILGGAVVLIMAGYNASRLSIQDERNLVLRSANTELDVKIAQIATLKTEIEGLKARQQAVEDLQGDRNQPVFLLDELVKQTPEGVYLRNFKQEGQRIQMNGFAQSQERVAELLRNLQNNSPWFEKLTLSEVKGASVLQGRTQKKVVEFNLAVDIKRPRDRDAAALAAAKGEAAGSVAVTNGGNTVVVPQGSTVTVTPAPAPAAK
jgi:type IV pilus assembly protein PilN